MQVAAGSSTRLVLVAGGSGQRTLFCALVAVLGALLLLKQLTIMASESEDRIVENAAAMATLNLEARECMAKREGLERQQQVMAHKSKALLKEQNELQVQQTQRDRKCRQLLGDIQGRQRPDLEFEVKTLRAELLGVPRLTSKLRLEDALARLQGAEMRVIDQQVYSEDELRNKVIGALEQANDVDLSVPDLQRLTSDELVELVRGRRM